MYGIRVYEGEAARAASRTEAGVYGGFVAEVAGSEFLLVYLSRSHRSDTDTDSFVS